MTCISPAFPQNKFQRKLGSTMQIYEKFMMKYSWRKWLWGRKVVRRSCKLMMILISLQCIMKFTMATWIAYIKILSIGAGNDFTRVKMFISDLGRTEWLNFRRRKFRIISTISFDWSSYDNRLKAHFCIFIW